MLAADTQFCHIQFSGKVRFCEAFGTDAVLYSVFTYFKEKRKSGMKLTLKMFKSKHLYSRTEYRKVLCLEPGVGSNDYIFS